MLNAIFQKKFSAQHPIFTPSPDIQDALIISCYISTLKLSLFFASSIVFRSFQVANMEIRGGPIRLRSRLLKRHSIDSPQWRLAFVRKV